MSNVTLQSQSERPTLGFLCATKGRGTLRQLILSFKRVAAKGDQLLIMGDDWEEPWVHELTGSGVTFIKRKKVGNFGHPHLIWALNERRVTTDYIGLIGDDDCFTSIAFDVLRDKLDTSIRSGVEWYPLLATAPGKTERFGGKNLFYFRMLLPNDGTPWATFGPDGLSDSLFFINEKKKLDHCVKVFKEVELNRIWWFPKDEWESYNIPGEWDESLATKYKSSWSEMEGDSRQFIWEPNEVNHGS